jgi:hypothetical protein
MVVMVVVEAVDGRSYARRAVVFVIGRWESIVVVVVVIDGGGGI